MPIIFRDDRLEAKTRRKRWVDFVKAKRAKLKLTQVRGSVLEFVDQFYAFLARRFRSTPGFLGRGRDFADSMT